MNTSITLTQFFQAYDDLFFEIPCKNWEFNSHEDLIKRSSEYATSRIQMK
jgi:hypothetical protein